jgi:hypothetical protein
MPKNRHGADQICPVCIGTIEEIRVSKGIAKWAKNFIPPTWFLPIKFWNKVAQWNLAQQIEGGFKC